MTKTPPDAQRPTPRCSICGQEADFTTANPHRPFCSARCKSVDLSKWLDEDYVISEHLAPFGYPGSADPGAY